MKFKAIGLIAFIAASTLVGATSKADAAVSNYQLSCNRISIQGNKLSANCRKINGNFNRTSIVLRGIENINGVLKVTSVNKISNYQLTCQKIRIVKGNILSANCKKRNGSLRSTALRLNGIENINGSLRYTSNP